MCKIKLWRCISICSFSLFQILVWVLQPFFLRGASVIPRFCYGACPITGARHLPLFTVHSSFVLFPMFFFLFAKKPFDVMRWLLWSGKFFFLFTIRYKKKSHELSNFVLSQLLKEMLIKLKTKIFP